MKFLIAFFLVAFPLYSESPVIQTILVLREGTDQEKIPNSKGVFSDVLNTKNKEELISFLGEEISTEKLQELHSAVLSALEQQGEYILALNYPKQEVDFGTVRIDVCQPIVKKVGIRGNKWRSKELYEKEFGVAAGQRLKASEILERVAWSNRNPFRHTELVIGPGTRANTVDVDFLVEDRWAYRPFAGMDNTGTNFTEQTRLYAGVNWGLPFERPDLLTYQYTAAPNPHHFYAHTASYLLFLPWHHEVAFYGGFSATHPEIPDFTQEGISVQTSFHYAIPLGPLYESKKQTVTWGFDYKNINSNVFFIEAPAVPIIAHQVNISQFYVAYAWERHFMVKAEFALSPFRWLPHQGADRYHQLRPHSSVYYAYANLALGDTYGTKYTFWWLFRGQLATGPLLPSEQFSLGGYDTIRGYIERDFLADDAICVNAEFRFPTLSAFKKDKFVFLAFSDFGYGHNYQSEQSSQSDKFLAGMGLGLRYNIIPYLTFRADYGVQLYHIFDQDSFGRLHVGGSISY